MEDPRAVYEERRGRRRSELDRWSRVELTVSVSRLVVAVLGLLAAWLSIQSRLFSPWWCVPIVVLFGALVVVHDRVLRRRHRLSRAVALYERGLRRLDGDWLGSGDDGARYLGEESAGGGHPYAADLDLFGRGSLYELLCETRTRAGADTLAAWLLAPPDVAEVRRRQEAVRDLSSRPDLREDLSTLGQELESELESEALASWARGEARLGRLRWLRPILALSSVANVLGILGWWRWGWGPAPLLIAAIAAVSILLAVRRRVEDSIRGVDRASADLSLISQLLLRVEAEGFEAEWLIARVDELRVDGRSPGLEIARLQKLVDLLESRRNAFFAPFGALLWWTTQLAFEVERWRDRSGARVARWLEIVGEVEAAASLAVFRFEHPEQPFPEIVELAGDGSPQLVGEALGHPLIPSERRVCNDVELGVTRRALVVSGSNMSGKSTYLRTCGVNVVLALAGAPVCARSLRLTRLAIGASIRIQDSLMEGASKFYAEITRLRLILDLTGGELPVLFLLDEILHGTNSHDRRIGAEAVVRALLDRGAIGLVTTHDLALAQIAEDPQAGLENVHFEDTIEEGRVCFDYRLREGVVRRSNALALMREVGLDV